MRYKTKQNFINAKIKLRDSEDSKLSQREKNIIQNEIEEAFEELYKIRQILEKKGENPPTL